MKSVFTSAFKQMQTLTEVTAWLKINANTSLSATHFYFKADKDSSRIATFHYFRGTGWISL